MTTRPYVLAAAVAAGLGSPANPLGAQNPASPVAQ